MTKKVVSSSDYPPPLPFTEHEKRATTKEAARRPADSLGIPVMTQSRDKKAILYRMMTDTHICPFGIKAKDLLAREGYAIEDHRLKTRAEVDDFKEKHQVESTPQTFIDGKRIGGCDDLLKYFNKAPVKREGVTYQPIIAIFAVTFLMAVAVTYGSKSDFSVMKLVELFVAFSMCVLAILKLRDLYSFSNQFITYDLLAGRVVRYAYVYPFVEAGAGILMIAGALPLLAASGMLFIGVIGGVSVIKAVYLDKRELKCACVGGDSNVPLGFISLTENLMMAGMAIIMLL